MLQVKPQLFVDTFYFPKRTAKKKQKPATRVNSTKKRPPTKEPTQKRAPLSPEAKKEGHRKRAAEQRSKAKALGLCQDCPQPAIAGQTRCEKHRADHLAYTRSRREASKQPEDRLTRKSETRDPRNTAAPQPATPPNRIEDRTFQLTPLLPPKKNGCFHAPA